MTTDEIQKLIEAGVPNSQAMVSGDEGKYEAVVISESFADLSMVKNTNWCTPRLNRKLRVANYMP